MAYRARAELLSRLVQAAPASLTILNMLNGEAGIISITDNNNVTVTQSPGDGLGATFQANAAYPLKITLAGQLQPTLIINSNWTAQARLCYYPDTLVSVPSITTLTSTLFPNCVALFTPSLQTPQLTFQSLPCSQSVVQVKNATGGDLGLYVFGEGPGTTISNTTTTIMPVPPLSGFIYKGSGLVGPSVFQCDSLDGTYQFRYYPGNESGPGGGVVVDSLQALNGVISQGFLLTVDNNGVLVIGAARPPA